MGTPVNHCTLTLLALGKQPSETGEELGFFEGFLKAKTQDSWWEFSMATMKGKPLVKTMDSLPEFLTATMKGNPLVKTMDSLRGFL
jgi:hypothetical protein